MVEPHQVGLPATGGRRVTGLRREEIAEVVGVSTDYYNRLEQGRAKHPSTEVLSALANALQLGPAERAHLHDLAQSPGQRTRNKRSSHGSDDIRPTLQATVSYIQDAPALIMNDRTDVLAWNRLAALVIADFPNLPAAQRNMAWQIFLNPCAREIHPDWDEAARSTVGILRMAAGRRPNDGALTRLIGELAMGSDVFAQTWASQHVHEKTHGPKHFRHREMGEINLHYETFHTPQSEGSTMLVVYTAEANSPDQAILDALSAGAHRPRPIPVELPIEDPRAQDTSSRNHPRYRDSTASITS